MVTSKLPPHLMQSHRDKCCSACKRPIAASPTLSLSAAFKKHVLEVHWANEKDDREAMGPGKRSDFH
jgi:hypothetical protein